MGPSVDNVQNNNENYTQFCDPFTYVPHNKVRHEIRLLYHTLKIFAITT